METLLAVLDRFLEKEAEIRIVEPGPLTGKSWAKFCSALQAASGALGQLLETVQRGERAMFAHKILSSPEMRGALGNATAVTEKAQVHRTLATHQTELQEKDKIILTAMTTDPLTFVTRLEKIYTLLTHEITNQHHRGEERHWASKTTEATLGRTKLKEGIALFLLGCQVAYLLDFACKSQHCEARLYATKVLAGEPGQPFLQVREALMYRIGELFEPQAPGKLYEILALAQGFFARRFFGSTRNLRKDSWRCPHLGPENEFDELNPAERYQQLSLFYHWYTYHLHLARTFTTVYPGTALQPMESQEIHFTNDLRTHGDLQVFLRTVRGGDTSGGRKSQLLSCLQQILVPPGTMDSLKDLEPFFTPLPQVALDKGLCSSSKMDLPAEVCEVGLFPTVRGNTKGYLGLENTWNFTNLFAPPAKEGEEENLVRTLGPRSVTTQECNLVWFICFLFLADFYFASNSVPTFPKFIEDHLSVEPAPTMVPSDHHFVVYSRRLFYTRAGSLTEIHLGRIIHPLDIFFSIVRQSTHPHFVHLAKELHN